MVRLKASSKVLPIATSAPPFIHSQMQISNHQILKQQVSLPAGMLEARGLALTGAEALLSVTTDTKQGGGSF